MYVTFMFMMTMTTLLARPHSNLRTLREIALIPARCLRNDAVVDCDINIIVVSPLAIVPMSYMASNIDAGWKLIIYRERGSIFGMVCAVTKYFMRNTQVIWDSMPAIPLAMQKCCLYWGITLIIIPNMNLCILYMTFAVLMSNSYI